MEILVSRALTRCPWFLCSYKTAKVGIWKNPVVPRYRHGLSRVVSEVDFLMNAPPSSDLTFICVSFACIYFALSKEHPPRGCSLIGEYSPICAPSHISLARARGLARNRRPRYTPQKARPVRPRSRSPGDTNSFRCRGCRPRPSTPRNHSCIRTAPSPACPWPHTKNTAATARPRWGR